MMEPKLTQNELNDQKFLDWAMQQEEEVEALNEQDMWDQMSQETEDDLLHEEQTWELIDGENEKLNNKKAGG